MTNLNNLDLAALYVGMHLLLLLALALVVVRQRAGKQITLGDGGDTAMRQAMRAHGNATEYVPLALIGLVVMALFSATPAWAIHALGAGLFLARVLHAQGLLTNEGRSFGRAAGTLATWIVYLALGAGLIWLALSPA